MATFNDLPPEIILRIFHFYLETERQIKLISNLSEVCTAWKNVCANSLLWKKYDGTLPFNVMMQLCKQEYFNNTKEIIISHIKSLENEHEKELFPNLINAEAIDLSLVRKFSRNTLPCIATSCTRLKKIVVGNLTEEPLTLSYTALETLFTERGCNITAIQICNCTTSSSKIFSGITKCCPNLEELNVTNNGYGTFPTKQMQMHCPKLKVLNLDLKSRVGETKHSSGFPNLEVFSYLDLKDVCITDKGFNSITFNSPDLKFLSLTKCYIKPESLISLPVDSLEYLYLSRSKVIQEKGLADVLERWSHSLKQVDLSYSVNACINRAALKLAKQSSPLEVLNLSFSKITASAVDNILESCTRLKVLNLDGCRNLGRGMKRTYYSEEPEFKTLSKKLKIFLADNSDENMFID